MDLQIPIPVQDIINLPMDEFNERLSKYELSETQLSLIRDIRRRGKNKVAAQNCRKRKLDQIMSLADEVKVVKKQKDELVSDRTMQLNKQKKIKERFTALYRHVFQVRAIILLFFLVHKTTLIEIILITFGENITNFEQFFLVSA